MNKFITVLGFALLSLTAQAESFLDGVYVTPATSAPQPVVRQTLPPTMEADQELNKELLACQGLYDGTQIGLRAVENCKNYVLTSRRENVRNAQQVARIDMDYRRQNVYELNAQQRRNESAVRANTQALQSTINSIQKLNRIFKDH